MEQQEIYATKMTPIELYIFNINYTASSIALHPEEISLHLRSYEFQKTILKKKGMSQEILDRGDSELLRKIMEHRK